MTSQVIIELSIEVVNNEIQVVNHYSDFLYVLDSMQTISIEDNKQIREACPTSLNSSLVDLIIRTDTYKFGFEDIYNYKSPILVLEELASKIIYRIPLRKTLSEAELLRRLELIGYNESAPNQLQEQLTNLESKINHKIEEIKSQTKQFHYNFTNLVELNDYSNDLLKIEEQIKDVSINYKVNIDEIALPSIASIKTYEPTEIDIRYQSLPGEDYCCKGIHNGCTIGTVYGNNPYTNDSKYCSAALHAGLINENGGVFHVKKIGKFTGYQGITKNGVTTLNWNEWEGLSFHRSDVELFAHSQIGVCGKYMG